MTAGKVQFEEDEFGLFTDKTTGQAWPVRRFTWKNGNDVRIQVINYGATVTSISFPDKNGKIEDIITGFDTFEGFLRPDNPYFGASVGRIANRIGNGQVHIGDKTYQVSKNAGRFQLHGGFKGFDKVLWEHHVDGTKLVLTYLSKDGEEGYPGDLIATATFELTGSNEFVVEYKAVTTKTTFVNMTNHAYFNLAGHQTGCAELYKHTISINADQITETDSDSIPTGELKDVADTVFDLRIPKVIGDLIDKVPGSDGFDNNFCITKGPEQGSTFVARAHHPGTGRVLEVYSNQPGVQFYTSNFFPKKDATKPLEGKNGTKYTKHGAFCLETQNWPDAPNHDNFPKASLHPGETYLHTVSYKFSIKH